MVNGHYRQRGDGTPVKTLDQAQDRAQKWLRDRGSGLTADEAEAFPGYHTLHTLRSGKIVGMPSANASTGTVWGHTWHGTHVATSKH
ncbi:hypothetical protein [Streptomyces sp. NPDC021012]|uniref:hypothetical protein n=1 Tax=unclassified Streptomyces TaxID=2593676 RepID=UPI0037A47A95